MKTKLTANDAYMLLPSHLRSADITTETGEVRDINRWFSELINRLADGEDTEPDDGEDTVEIRIPVAVSADNEFYARGWSERNAANSIDFVAEFFAESQVHIITARVPKYRIPEIKADKVEPVDTEDAT